MKTSRIHSTTQNFTEIKDISQSTVFLQGGNACALIEVSSVNFYLLSQEEQEARVYGFMSLLNSLSFPIQIYIVSKNIDVSAYLSLIDQKISSEKRPRIQDHLRTYKTFIQSLIKSKSLLDKKFYVVIPFSNLELGPLPAGATHTAHADHTQRIVDALINKRGQILTQLNRIGLASRVLPDDEIIKVFYEVFNQETFSLNFETNDVKNIIM
jgi:hypothetical protein